MAAQKGAEQELVGSDEKLEKPGHGAISGLSMPELLIADLPSAASSAITLQFLFRANCLKIKNYLKNNALENSGKRKSQGVA